MKKLFWTENLRFRHFCAPPQKVLAPLEICLATPLSFQPPQRADRKSENGAIAVVCVLALNKKCFKFQVFPLSFDSGVATGGGRGGDRPPWLHPGIEKV